MSFSLTIFPEYLENVEEQKRSNTSKQQYTDTIKITRNIYEYTF